MIIGIGYPLGLSIALLALGIAGVVASRHFIIMMLSVEVIFVGSIILLVGFFDMLRGSSLFLLLLSSIWAVLVAEVSGIVVFYIYMRKSGLGFDVSKFSRLSG